VDSVLLSLWGVLASVGIIGVFVWLLGIYETRRSVRIDAERARKDAEHAAR
jgi:hypothetical protein